jgi:hypothetical protein
MRVRRSWCCSRVGAAAAPASSPTSYYKQKTKVYKGSSAMPQLTQKKTTRCGMLRLSRTMLEKRWQKANFGAGKICLCAQRNTKIKRYQRAEIGLKRAYLVLEYIKIICSICILFL